MTSLDASLVARARLAAETLAPLADAIEKERGLPAEAVAALVGAGIFKLFVPQAYGGLEADLETALSVIEELARADGSAGWCAMVGSTSGLMSIFLQPDVAREIFGAPDAIACGVFAPMGRAVPADGGHRVSGRWPFASGCKHSTWRMGGALVPGEAPLPGGAPNVRSMLFRAEETRVVDTWDTSGLRGTGSHDFEATDVFVPASRSFSTLTDRPRYAGILSALPFFGVLAASVAAVTLGIARGALDAFAALATAKHSLGAKRSIAHRELVQLGVAQAEGNVRAARALLHETAREASASAARGEAPSLRDRALLRVAACHATTASAAAVDTVYEAAGASSIYTKSPLQRQFRDVHVATQHIMVSPTAAILAGRVLLGVETDTGTL
jgi:alkylation response protein AidB-like acyl-CoA dehydrogenase